MENIRLQSETTHKLSPHIQLNKHTVKPFDKVVLSVVIPEVIGVAYPLVRPGRALRAARFRSALLRLRASRRDAMRNPEQSLERREQSKREEMRGFIADICKHGA